MFGGADEPPPAPGGALPPAPDGTTMPPKPPSERTLKKRTSFKMGGAMATKHMHLSNPRPKLEIDPNAADLIAFAGVEFICFEYDPTITVHLVRRGTGSGEISLTWKTENGNVDAASYELQTGAITFKEGQMAASLELVINDNPAWSTESTMCVVFSRARTRLRPSPRLTSVSHVSVRARPLAGTWIWRT